MANVFVYQHTDFPAQKCSPGILARHLRHAGYAVALLGINRKPAVPSGFTVQITFAADLQPAEETDLNAQVAFHDPDDPAQIPPSSAPPESIAPEDFDAWGDDQRDDTAPILAAMAAASAAGGGVVELRPGANYRISGTLVIPTRVMLKVPNLARLRMMVDADAISLQAGAVLDLAGELNCAAPINYTSSAILLDGTQRYNLGDGTLIRGRGLVRGRIPAIVTDPAPQGRGLYLHAHTVENDHVAWVDVDVQISGFEFGVHLHAEVPATGKAYVGGNTIRANVANCVEFFRLEGGGRGSDNSVTGNDIRGTLQTHVGFPYAQRAVYCETWLNDISLTPFDWGASSAASPKALEFTKTSGNNRMLSNVIPAAVIDESATGENQNRIETLSEYVPQVRGMAAPPAIDQPTFLGDQNDMLAAAWDLYTITPSVAPSQGSVLDAFSTTPNTGPRWNAPAGEVVVTVDLGGVVGGCYALGCNFGQSLIPRSVDLEYENGGQWVSVYSSAANNRRDVLGYFGAAGVNGTTRVRLRMSDPDAADLWLTRLFMFASSRPGRAFVRQERVLWAETPNAVDPGTIQPGDTALINIATPRAEVIDAAGPVATGSGFPVELIASATVSFGGNVQIRIRNTGTVPIAAPNKVYGCPVFKR